MEKTISERITYLYKQVWYYKAVGDQVKIDLYMALINELQYWQYIYEPGNEPMGYNPETSFIGDPFHSHN